MNKTLVRAGWRLALIAASVLPRPAMAQDQDVPPPKPPFVSALPDSASWKMAFSKPKRADSVKPVADPTKQLLGDTYVRTVDVTKSGDIRREVTTWSNSAVTEAWVFGDINAYEDQSKQIVIRQVSSTGRSLKDAMQNFPLLEWINLQSYKDVEVIGGKKCYAFKQATPLTEVAAGYFALVPGMSSQTSAFIAVDSGLPVSTQVNDVTVTYTFGPGSDVPLTVPERFQQATARFQTALRRLNHLPSPP